MSRLADEIETLLAHTTEARTNSFEAVRVKRRQLVRRRYTRLAGATLVIAAVVGYQLQGDDSGQKAAPTAPPSPAVSPHSVVSSTTAGLPLLAGTAWRIASIGSNPGAFTTGAGPVDEDLFAQIRFSSQTNAVLSIGGVTRSMTFTERARTMSFDEGIQTPLEMSDDVAGAEYAIEDFRDTPLTPHLQNLGTLLALVSDSGEVINLIKLEPAGVLGRAGDAWSVSALRTPSGVVPIALSLNARLRVESSYEAQFAVGANNALVGVLVRGTTVQLTLFPFSEDKPRPGELAATRALSTISGPLTATRTGRTLVLTSTAGVALTLVARQ